MIMNRKAFFVSLSGGLVRYLADGELLFEVAVPPGRVSVAEYVDMWPDGASVEYSGVTLLEPRLLGGVSFAAGRTESGANPDFVPTPASRYEVEMKKQIDEAKLLNRTMRARMNALANVDFVPDAAALDPAADVIE